MSRALTVPSLGLCWWLSASLVTAADLGLPGASVRLVAVGTVPHNALDKAGETLGGFGSALACDPDAKDRYLSVSDRGPGDGTIDYRPRVQTWRIDRAPDDPARLRIVLEETTLLTGTDGQQSFTGLRPGPSTGGPAPLPARKEPPQGCIDPEGIVCAPDKTLYVSDEYGPFVYHFKRDGQLLGVLRPPMGYSPANRTDGLDFDEDAPASGRMPNRGFEGLAISPDGATLTALLQSALVQDGGKEGGVTRMLAFDAGKQEPVAEYAYAMEAAAEVNDRLGLSGKGEGLKSKNLSVCELHAVDPTHFLVIERDNRGLNGSAEPEPAADKSVFLIDTAGATNLLKLEGEPYTFRSSKPYSSLSKAVEEGKVKPVGKRLLIDLVHACRESGNPIFAAGIPEKWEGLALRPADGPGRYTLLVSTDNDFLTPTLQLAGRGGVSFPKARQAQDTVFLWFEVTIP